MLRSLGNPAFRTQRHSTWLVVCVGALFGVVGCSTDESNIGSLDKVWGRRGVSDGRFQKPRAMTIDKQDRLYVVDMTARIQVFDAEGKFIRSWQTPDYVNGRPTGLSIDRDGNVAVPDTHYYQVLFYSPEGKLLRKLGGEHGNGPGQFGLVTDVAQDSAGNYYVSEYGEFDRIQKFTPKGQFILQWGGHGDQPGQFSRPQAIVVDKQDRIWVADSCNHRIQVFDSEGKLLFTRGEEGSELGKLSYPYNLIFDDDGNLYVCEYGNHRVQKFSPEGESLGSWGKPGREEGQLFNPWSIVRDSQGRTHVLDTYNHRVQRVRM
jgi:DNA-binding beta-propeller fold protein YncE